jgi:cystathionine beta-lyase
MFEERRVTHSLDQIIDRNQTNSAKWEFIFRDGEAEYTGMSQDVLGQDQVLPLWVADMDFHSPQAVIDALTRRAQHGVFGYTFPTDAYFQAIINWMDRRHNWQVEKEWILTTPGVIPAVAMMVQTYTEPGDGVLLQMPVYHPFHHAIENNNRVIVHNTLKVSDGYYEMDFEDLEASAKEPSVTMAILCSPHNPIGRVWTPDELRRFGQICYENDVLVISDEIHHDLIMSWAAFTPYGIVNADLMDKAVVCTAPSKTFNLPGLKTSNVFVQNPELREEFEKTMARNGLHGINAFGLVALQTAYESGDVWLENVLAYIEENYYFLKSFVAEHMPQVGVTQLEGTYLAWLDCRYLGLDGETLWQKLMDEARVNLNNGAMFGEEGDGYLRVNIACPRPILQEALTRMSKVL